MRSTKHHLHGVLRLSIDLGMAVMGRLQKSPSILPGHMHGNRLCIAHPNIFWTLYVLLCTCSHRIHMDQTSKEDLCSPHGKLQNKSCILFENLGDICAKSYCMALDLGESCDHFRHHHYWSLHWQSDLFHIHLRCLNEFVGTKAPDCCCFLFCAVNCLRSFRWLLSLLLVE